MTEELTKIQIYCSAFYNAMDNDSVVIKLDDGTEVKVWKGLITKTAAGVGAGEGVYSRVVERLTALGCIDVLEKGRRNIPSTVALHYPPTREVWDQKISPEDLTKRRPPAMLEAELKNIQRTLGGIDVIAAFKNIEERLTDLNFRVSQLEKESNSTNE